MQNQRRFLSQQTKTEQKETDFPPCQKWFNSGWQFLKNSYHVDRNLAETLKNYSDDFISAAQGKQKNQSADVFNFSTNVLNTCPEIQQN